MRSHPRPFLAVLIASIVVSGANAETAGVKDSTLSRAREALTHYDLGPDGTLRLLQQLGRYAVDQKGTAHADEAAFLRAAAASDLLFISDFSEDIALRERLALTLAVPSNALQQRIAAELRASAHGVYRAPAEAALAAMEIAQPDHALFDAHDARADALLLRRAVQFGQGQHVAQLAADAHDALLTAEAHVARLTSGARPAARTAEAETPEPPALLGPGAHFASLGLDPCEGAKTCPDPFAGLDVQGRRALWFMQRLGEALQRLDKTARLGDPLAAALAEPLAALRKQLLATRVRLPPSLPPSILQIETKRALPWPVPEVLLLVSETEVRYGWTPLARITDAGSVELIAQATPAFPKLAPLVALREFTSYTRPIDELVAALRKLPGDAGAVRSAAITTIGELPAHVLGRVLVSLDKAGVTQLALLGRAADGGMLGVPLHVTLAGVGPSLPATELRLRLRLGGYSLSVGGVTTDIPRVKDENGWRFDVETLRGIVGKRSVKSAAVSFMGDVAGEQLVRSVFPLRPARNPVELIVP